MTSTAVPAARRRAPRSSPRRGPCPAPSRRHRDVADGESGPTRPAPATTCHPRRLQRPRASAHRRAEFENSTTPPRPPAPEKGVTVGDVVRRQPLIGALRRHELRASNHQRVVLLEDRPARSSTSCGPGVTPSWSTRTCRARRSDRSACSGPDGRIGTPRVRGTPTAAHATVARPPVSRLQQRRRDARPQSGGHRPGPPER